MENSYLVILDELKIYQRKNDSLYLWKRYSYDIPMTISDQRLEVSSESCHEKLLNEKIIKIFFVLRIFFLVLQKMILMIFYVQKEIILFLIRESNIRM